MKGLLALTLVFLFSFNSRHPAGPGHFYGAWEMDVEIDGKIISHTKIYTASYFIYSAYEKANGAFVVAGGGTWVMDANGITETYEFHTGKSEMVGENLFLAYSNNHDDDPLTFVFELNGKHHEQTWKKIDDGRSPLFGAWRITQRERNGTMQAMTMGARKTMKVLSGSRFQWAAFNVDTKEFSGTGGGNFTTKDGKYEENIMFFSRDNSRVGMSLEFDFEVKGDDWYHSGLSSRGDPISEVWTNQD